MLDDKNWQRKAPASDEALIRLASIAPFPLPESYLDFLAYGDGGEGPFGVQPCWLVLDPIDTVVGTETSGTFHEFFPNYFVIGSNGAGEAIALTIGKSGKAKVVYFDMTNTDMG
jgi:hypothetical protein